MSALVFFIYRFFAVPLAWTVFQLGSFFGGSKWKALREAKNSQAFLTKGQSLEDIQRARPFWIHAASGEIEYARPVIRELKKRYPEIPILITYGSISALNTIAKMPEVDAWGAVPWEFRTSIRAFLRRFQPRAVLFARTDVWPVLMDEVAARKTPSLLFSATFAENSSRLKFGIRHLTKRTLRQLSDIQVVSQEDRQQLMGLLDLAKIRVAGDTRYDQVFHRLAHPNPLPLPKPSDGAPVFVAGSTWPEDEVPLLAAFAEATPWRMILAPHEVTSAHLTSIEDRLKTLKLDFQRLSQTDSWTTRVLIVDRVGLLAEFYTWGSLAFVGGSFKKQVHSVMEPLAAGLPVLVGPHHLNNREALDFQSVKLDGIATVRVVHTSEEIKNILSQSGKWPLDDLKKTVRNLQGATNSVLVWVDENVQTSLDFKSL